MHLIFEENPHENSYSNCTILTLAWTPFYDDDIFRQYIKRHIRQPANNQQLSNLNSNAQQSQQSRDSHQPRYMSNNNFNNLSKYGKKFTCEGRSENHGWLAVGNINGVVGVSLSRCKSDYEGSHIDSDHDDEKQQDGNDLPNSQDECRDDCHEQNEFKKSELRRHAKYKRNGRKRSEKKSPSPLNHLNDPDDEAFRTNHHLRAHGSEILIVKWNEPYQRLATVDSKGCIFIWSKRNGRFQIESPLNNRNKTVVDFDWSNDGETALICYIDSFVLVGSGYGQRYWHSMLNLDDYHITCGVWSPDDEQLIFGVSNGSILVIYLQNSELTEMTIRERISIRSMCWSMGHQLAQQQFHRNADSDDIEPSLSSHSGSNYRSQTTNADNNQSYRTHGENQSNNDSYSSPIWNSRSTQWETTNEGFGGENSGVFTLNDQYRSNTSSSAAINNITNAYRLNRINTAIRWRQQSTSALYNGNPSFHMHTIIRNPDLSLANSTQSRQLLSSDTGHNSRAVFGPINPTDSHQNISHRHVTSGCVRPEKNVLAVDFCDGTIQLYSGGLDDADPRTITTNLKSLHMQWSHDGSLLAVAGFYTVSSLSIAISWVQRYCSGQSVKDITESLACDVAKEKRVHPMIRPEVYYLNVVHFYTPQGNLRYSQFIKYCAHPVSALAWGHKDQRLFIATGPVLHTAQVYKNVPPLQILSKATIKRGIRITNNSVNYSKKKSESSSSKSKILCHCGSEDSEHSSRDSQNNSNISWRLENREDKRKELKKRRPIRNCEQVYRLPLPTKLLQTIDNMFTRTLKCHIPTSKCALDFVWKVPAPDQRLYCTLICYESQYANVQEKISTSNSTSTSISGSASATAQINGESNYILYLEYLGSLIPILKAKLIGHLKPEFVIFDPQTQKRFDSAQCKSYQDVKKDPNTHQAELEESTKLRRESSKTHVNKIMSRSRSKSATPSSTKEVIFAGENSSSNDMLNNLYSSAGRNKDSYEKQCRRLAKYIDKSYKSQMDPSSFLDLSRDNLNSSLDSNSEQESASNTYDAVEWDAIADEASTYHEQTRSFRRRLQYLHHYHAYDCLPEERIIAKVKSNIWGTKFKIIGCDPLPETIATMVYKTSLLHLQPRQVCITIKDLENVCSNCFRLKSVNNDKTFLNNQDPFIRHSSSKHDCRNEDFSYNLDGELSSYDKTESSQPPNTVFLEVGEPISTPLKTMSCTHRPLNSDLNQIAIGDINDYSRMAIDSARPTEIIVQHKLPQHNTVSCENISYSEGLARATAATSTIDYRRIKSKSISQVKASKRRAPSESNQQQIENSTSAESPSKKLALDIQLGEYYLKSNSRPGTSCNFIDDDDDILTLYMDRKPINGSDQNQKEGSTASISLKMSSGGSSNGTLHPQCLEDDALTMSIERGDERLNCNLAPLGRTSTEPCSPLLSISAITKMIVDLSSRAADDDNLVNKSVPSDTQQENKMIDGTTTILQMPQTPVHRPRRRKTNTSNHKYEGTQKSINQSTDIMNIQATNDKKVSASLFKDTSWSNHVDTCSNQSSQMIPLAPPRRKFTKKLREQLRKSALSLNVGSSFGSNVDSELQEPLLRSSYKEFRELDVSHLMTQSQPCTPVKKKRSLRGCYENAALEYELPDQRRSHFRENIETTNSETLRHKSTFENKENDSSWNSSKPRRCQSMTKLFSKAIQKRLNYLDCSSNAEINCMDRNHMQSINKVNHTKTNSSDKSIDSRNQSPEHITDHLQGPNIDKFLREHKLLNKPPVWNTFSQVYQLDFGGRVTQESAKNFQIEYQGQLAMQFGRIDNRAYTLDYQYPFNAIQAMGVALASLTQRLK